MRTLAPVADICMFVMFPYVSLSPARNEIFAGLMDCNIRLGEVAHFGKIFGFHMDFFEKNTTINIQYGFIENGIAHCQFMKSSYDIL